MKWFKAANRLTTDPKLALVALKTKCYRHEVVALWTHALCMASGENNKGVIGSIDFEEIDLAMEFTSGRAEKIFKGFVDKNMIKDGKIANWDKYQADTSTERTRKWRERKRNETSQNATLHHSDDVTVEERRVDKIRKVIADRMDFESEALAMQMQFTPDEAGKIYKDFKDYYDARDTTNIIDLKPLWAKWLRSEKEKYGNYKQSNRSGARKGGKPSVSQAVNETAELIKAGKF